MARASRQKERHEVLFEEIGSKAQLVLEGHSTLNRSIEALRQDIGSVKEELGHVEHAVTENNERLDVLIKRFDVHHHAHTH